VAELRELEVELLEGDESVLREMAVRIAASGLAMPEPRSKMAIAAGLLDGSGPIGPGDPFAAAGRRVIHRHLRRMLEREAHVRAGDQLGLKQMRVATRRMRAVWRVFDGAYRRAAQRRYVGELRQVADRLGAVRDLDVLIETLPADAPLEPLAADWRARRQQAFEELLRAFDGPDYQRFVDDYLAFARTPREGVARSLAGARVADVAAGRIWSAHQRVLAHLPAIQGTPPGRGPDVAALHALRIDAKRLRYTLETFRDVLVEPFVSDLVGRLVRLQDHLGELNDARVAAEAVRHWLDGAGSSAPAESIAAARTYLAAREAAVERLRRSHARPLRGVAGVIFRRRLARAIGPLTER
jgi:CHAD domain-containing protein